MSASKEKKKPHHGKGGKNFKSLTTIQLLEAQVASLVTVPFGDPKFKEILHEYGFVVVEGVMSPEEQAHANVLMRKNLEGLVDTRSLDPKLASVFESFRSGAKGFPQASLPGISQKGFLSRGGLPQCDYAWFVRSNQKVRGLFAELYDCTPPDLCVSLDVPFLSDLPPQKECDEWPHADQRTDVPLGPKESYQAIIYVNDATGPDSAGTMLIPKSHTNLYCKLLLHSTKLPEIKVVGPSSSSSPDQTELTARHHSLYLRDVVDLPAKRKLFEEWRELNRQIPVSAGGVLIFDSRCIHQGNPHGKRLAQAVSWAPKAERDMAAFSRKKEAIVRGIATTHWPTLGLHHGASFGKLKDPAYSSVHENCILPVIPLPSPDWHLYEEMI